MQKESTGKRSHDLGILCNKIKAKHVTDQDKKKKVLKLWINEVCLNTHQICELKR